MHRLAYQSTVMPGRWPGHPRLDGLTGRKTWMAGTSPAMTNLSNYPKPEAKSGRAAHIGVAAADHALGGGLGVRLAGGGAGAIFQLGQLGRLAPSEPGL